MMRATLLLSVHRPEMADILADEFFRYDVIVLEEPPEPDFKAMLEGRTSVQDYLMPIDVEYPDFSIQMCRHLRRLHHSGKKIFQVEPYLEVLSQVHEVFAEGGCPTDLDTASIHYPVYLAEKKATGALLNYYQAVSEGLFERTIETVLNFARADAARFRLRDALRAQAIAALTGPGDDVGVEAGVIHFQMWSLLRKWLPAGAVVRLLHLADAALERIGQKGPRYGPGDQLTLLFAFHPQLPITRRLRLLAARAVIFAKLVTKTEIVDDIHNFPHLQDEQRCMHNVQHLSFNDCGQLFSAIGRLDTQRARRVVNRYLGRTP